MHAVICSGKDILLPVMSADGWWRSAGTRQGKRKLICKQLDDKNIDFCFQGHDILHCCKKKEFRLPGRQTEWTDPNYWSFPYFFDLPDFHIEVKPVSKILIEESAAVDDLSGSGAQDGKILLFRYDQVIWRHKVRAGKFSQPACVTETCNWMMGVEAIHLIQRSETEKPRFFDVCRNLPGHTSRHFSGCFEMG